MKEYKYSNKVLGLPFLFSVLFTPQLYLINLSTLSLGTTVLECNIKENSCPYLRLQEPPPLFNYYHFQSVMCLDK